MKYLIAPPVRIASPGERALQSALERDDSGRAGVEVRHDSAYRSALLFCTFFVPYFGQAFGFKSSEVFCRRPLRTGWIIVRQFILVSVGAAVATAPLSLATRRGLSPT